MVGAPMSELTETLLRLLAVFGLVLANAFFVATEFALVAVRRSRMETIAREGNASAQAVLRSLGDLDQYIAGTQLGITIASLMLGWIGESALVHLFQGWLAYLPEDWAHFSSHALAVAVAFGIITFMHVVLGELVPKTLALQFPDDTAMWVARPMQLCVWVMKPLIYALNGTGNLVLRLLGLPPDSGHGSVHSVDELKILMDHSHKEGVIHLNEKEMLNRVFSFKDLVVRQVMVHRLDIAAIDVKASLEDVRRLTREQPHSRYPVFSENTDHIVGLFHTKDLVIESPTEAEFDLARLARPALWVPETLPLDELLVQLRRARTQVAMVLDEFGGTSGMVTLQDVTEELLGELEDEFDPRDDVVETDPHGEPVVEGRTRLDEMTEVFGMEMEDEDVDTIGGLVIKHLGRVPEEGDTVTIEEVRFTVAAMEGRRILTVRLTPETEGAARRLAVAEGVESEVATEIAEP